MNLSEFAHSIKHPEPVYLVRTKDPYWTRQVSKLCESQVAESARAFDWSVFDLEDEGTVPGEVLNTARTLPWMSSYRWILVKHAEHAKEELAVYLTDPAPRTVLVLQLKGQLTAAWKRVPVVEPGAGRSPSDFIQRKVREEKFFISREATEMLLELVGDDLGRLESELEKLLLWRVDERDIDLDAVLSLTLDVRERDIFELIRSIALRKEVQALRILNRLFQSGMVAQQMLPLLYWNFSRLLVARELIERGMRFNQIVPKLKIWTFKDRGKEIRSYSPSYLARLLLKLREADRLSKSSGGDPRMILERLVIDTCRS